MSRILITTFQTWLSHHVSNSSDDLLVHLEAQQQLPQDCQVLHQVPVDFHAAPSIVLAKIAELQPQLILCCGMAENRSQLSVESNGRFQSDFEFAVLDFDQLLYGTTATIVSHDAGQFVCNYLYYQVLRYVRQHQPQTQALFVHVPLLSADNLDTIAQDFLAIVDSFKTYI